jgi:cytochrome b
MTKSARFIRFNFWQGNIVCLLLVLYYGYALGVLNIPSAIFHPAFFVTMFTIALTSSIYRKRLGIKSNVALNFAEDEREQSIIYKIHSRLLNFLIVTVTLLLLGIPFITIFTSDIYIALAVIAGALILIGFLGNIIYYCTWLKYYQKL